MECPVSSFTPLLPRPKGDPLIIGDPEYATFTRYWESPAPGVPGKFEVLHDPNQQWPSSYSRDQLLTEARSLTTYADDNLREYYAYFGVHTARQTIEGSNFYEVSYQHPRTVVERLGALQLDTITIALYDGAEYPARTLAQELAENKRVLAALYGTSQAHDIMAHLLNPWILIYSEVIDRWSEKAAAFVDAGEKQVQSFMNELDVTMSSVGIGDDIKRALHYRPYPQTAAMYWRQAAHNLDLKFKQPGQVYVPISPNLLCIRAHMVVDAIAANLQLTDRVA